MTSARLLHVTNGHHTGRLLEASQIGGTWSVWADPLYDGPVPDVGDDEMVRVRARHLAGAADRTPAVERDLQAWRQAIVAHQGEVVLWFEHDLFDQLALVQLLTWLGARDRRHISLICIDGFPGYASFKGLGQLTSTELASLLPTRRTVDDGQYALAIDTWNAFRQPAPAALDRIARRSTPELPFLAPAIRRFLEDYPWTRDGLSRTERRFLQLVEGGVVGLAQIFARIHDDERAYFVTDSGLIELAESLSATSPALVTLTPIDGADGKFERTVTLTATGREVLAGHLDRVAQCGIDRWYGGVHLISTSPWRWDDERQAVVRTG